MQRQVRESPFRPIKAITVVDESRVVFLLVWAALNCLRRPSSTRELDPAYRFNLGALPSATNLTRYHTGNKDYVRLKYQPDSRSERVTREKLSQSESPNGFRLGGQ